MTGYFGKLRNLAKTQGLGEAFRYAARTPLINALLYFNCGNTNPAEPDLRREELRESDDEKNPEARMTRRSVPVLNYGGTIDMFGDKNPHIPQIGYSDFDTFINSRHNPRSRPVNGFDDNPDSTSLSDNEMKNELSRAIGEYFAKHGLKTQHEWTEHDADKFAIGYAAWLKREGR